MLSHLLSASPVTLDPLNRAIQASPPLVDAEPALEPRLHTVEEIAAELRVSTKTIRRRIKDGTLRKAPIGGRLVRISAEELRRLTSRPGLEP